MIKHREIALLIMQTCLLAGITLFGVVPFSCKVTTEGIEIIGGDYTAPAIENITVLDEKTVQMEFSQEIELKTSVVSPVFPGISDSDLHSFTEKLSPSLAAAYGEYGKVESEVTSSEDGKIITFHFAERTEIGKSYEIFGTVEDRIGNTLTFCVPFVGFNSQVPKIIITEAQIKYAKGSVKGETVYRGEYLEFLALEDGNLAGLEVYSAMDGEGKKYEFPAIEVTKGEVFLVHLRTAGEGCISEVEDDLDLATAAHSREGVRDLWSENTNARFNDTADVIILRNTVDGSIMDGLMYSMPEVTEWKSETGAAAMELCEYGIYSSGELCYSANAKGVSPLKSITRVNSNLILQSILDDEEIDFPVQSDDSTWSVTPATPGYL